MNHSDIAALMKGAAPVIRDLVVGIVGPLVDRIDSLERELAASRAVDHSEAIRAVVSEAVAALPVAKDGKDADPEFIRLLVDAAVANIPAPEPGAPGKDADPAVVAEMVAAAVAAIPPAPAGKDADPEVTAELVRSAVAVAVASLPPAEPGKSVTLDDIAPLVEQEVARAVAALPAPEPGKEGPPGKLAIVKEFAAGVHYEGDVRTHKGGTYQAIRDTATEPPDGDWICLAAPGRAGADARQIAVRGTYDAEGYYGFLDVVALNGATFIAKHDEPGPCPGEGWQLMSAQGKTGKPGEGRKGDPGKAIKGDPGPPVVAATIDDQGMLTLVNGDGSTVECDLYPVLSKVMR